MITSYRSKMSKSEEAEYNAYLVGLFNQICASAYNGEAIFGSSADMKAHTSMSNVYYAYFIGAKDLKRCKEDTQKIRHEYINDKTREAMSLEGYRSMQAMYHAVGEAIRDYKQSGKTIETADKLIEIIDGRYRGWEGEHGQ